MVDEILVRSFIDNVLGAMDTMGVDGGVALGIDGDRD
jgi:hypothetical protein